MTLRAKTFLLTSGGLGVLLLALYVLTSVLLLTGTRRSDERLAVKTLQDSRAQIEAECRGFVQSFRDYAIWTKTWDFVRTPNQEYLKENFNAAWLQTVEVDFLAIVTPNGKSVWEREWNASQRKLSPMPPAIRNLYRAGSPWIKHRDAQDFHSGLVAVDGGALMVISAPIVRSDYSGEIRGSFLAARWLSPEKLYGIGKTVSADLRLLPLNAEAKAGRDEAAVSDDMEEVNARGPLRDHSRVPRWLLEITQPAATTIHGAETLSTMAYVLLAAFILCCAFALWPIEFLVLKRLSQLSTEVRHLQKEENRGERVQVNGRDEIAQLAGDINSTLETLAALDRQKTESQALQREMAQTALTAGDCFFIYEPKTEAMEWQGDVDGHLGYAQGAFPRLFQAWQAHIHHDDRDVLQRAYDRAFAERTPFEVEIRVHRADGQMVHWMHRGKVLQDGHNLKLLGACLDITGRKLSEAARRRTEARLARIVETSADAIVLFDTQGQVIFANAGAAQMFGCRVEELWSRHHLSPEWGAGGLDGKPLEPLETAFSRVERTRQAVHNLEQTMKGVGGETIIVTINAAPLPDENGDFAGVVASFSDISEHLSLQNRLTHQAFHDALTGLANRELMRDRLAHALALCKRTDSEIGLLFIDLDNFKWVNDSLGHQAGDELLCEVAARLLRSLRESDTAARFGGDEFVVLLESMENPAYSVSVAERLVAILSEPFLVAGREVFTSPSIGLTFSEKDSDVETMLSQADAAMYEAKRRGKGRFEVFQQNLSAAALERIDIEADLRRALGNGEFFLVYQPKVSLLTGDVIGVEALLRWKHPQKGFVSPSQFIPIAEETGLIVPIGQFVLGAACAQMNEWNRGREMLGLPGLKVAVNVSARQFHTAKLGVSETNPELPQLAREVEIILAQTNLRPSDLVLEITESLLMERTQESLHVLRALKTLGVKLAIDDFGTGYSSLAYLRAFPFDYLKIDREFVQQIDSESGPSVIVGSIISLSHALSLKVVAEGAERPEEVEKLRSLGCDFAQGYYFSRPLPAREIERLLFPDLSKSDKTPAGQPGTVSRPGPRLLRK